MGNEIFTQFEVILDLEDTYPLNQEVGSLYDVAINGVGLSLYDGEGTFPDYAIRRYTVPLDPERFATTDTPFSDNVQRYVFAGWDDFSSGAGQLYKDREEANPARYWHSQGIDVFTEPGQFSLLPATEKITSDTRAILLQAEDILYIVDRDAISVFWYSDPDTATQVTLPVEITVIHDATSDGSDIYLATDQGIYKGDSAGFAAWSAHVVTTISWVFNRIAGAYLTKLWTFDVDGYFDTPGTGIGPPPDESGSLPWLDMPRTWGFRDIVSGGGFVWIAARAASRSTVYRWQPDTGEFPQPAWELPHNELANELTHYQGNVLVRAAVVDDPDPTPDAEDDTIAARIYRCVVDQAGALVPYLAAEILEADTANSDGAFYATSRFVYFGWSAMDDDQVRSGLGIFDLSTGGWARNLMTDAIDTSGRVESIMEWRNQVYFAVRGQGVWRSTPDAILTEGYLDTSISDQRSTLRKVLDDVRLVFAPLRQHNEIEVHISTDNGQTFLDRDIVANQSGQRVLVYQHARLLESVGLRVYLRLNPGSQVYDSPEVQVIQARMHMQGVADQIIELPIDCSDHVAHPTRARGAENVPNSGANRRVWLEGLTQQLVALQDVDSHVTKQVQVYQIVQVESETVRTYRESRGTNELVTVAKVTARRPLRISARVV